MISYACMLDILPEGQYSLIHYGRGVDCSTLLTDRVLACVRTAAAHLAPTSCEQAPWL